MIETGSVVDGFTVGERIHEGGMAVLYRVSAPGQAGPLVMKVPRLGHGEPATSVVSFEVEQTVLRALRGPHVPRLVAAGDLAHEPYLVMEQVEGRPLTEWVERAPVPAAEVARLGQALATAVHDLHAQEALHLDVKPSNVLVRPDGEVVLVDFGLARHAHFPDLLAEELRHPVGSAPYISPEQVVGVRWDPRSDVFAVGVVLYELATGRLPFGAPPGRRLRARLYRRPVPPRALAPGVPPWLQEVILRCLEPDAARRYESAAQLAFDLAHPGAVELTALARQRRRPGPLATLAAWFRAAGRDPAPLPRPGALLSGAPIVLVAVATERANDAALEALRQAAARALAAAPASRLACATVIDPVPELGTGGARDTAARRRIDHLVRLRHFAEPLGLPAGRVSCHVLESADPAAALLDYARSNHVDHLVIGAPPPPRVAGPVALPAFVSVRVALEAPCSVTLVRSRDRD